MTGKERLPHIIAALTFAVLAALAPACTSTEKGSPAEGGSRSAPASFSSIDELDIAIRDASDYLNENIPRGSKIVILNIQSNSSDLSDYIIDELIANAVNDKVFTVVDRQQLDAIRSEQDFQLSGEVDDSDALAIGRFFGAQTIVSGAVNRLGAGYRIRIRALEVQTAQVQGQYNHNIASSQVINSLMASSGTATGTAPAAGAQPNQASTAESGNMASAQAAQTAQPEQPAAAPARTAAAGPPITGTAVPGNSLAEKFAWLQRSADSHNTYILELSANENIESQTLNYSGAINITIVLRGDEENRTIRLRSNGTMFTVRQNVTLVLDNNVTLMGHNGNTGSMVMVEGGTLRMRTGSAITGNIIRGDGGGVYTRLGTFEMSGGTISGNTASGDGGGVYNRYGTFTMNGGNISGNTASQGGGGVWMNSPFDMNNGIISGNTASQGGGVYVNSYNFNMRGGTITGNTAIEMGGGVCVPYGGTFNKTGGTITGYNSDQANGNVVNDGSVLARRGHAVYVNDNRRKETTAGPGNNLNSSTATGWDN